MLKWLVRTSLTVKEMAMETGPLNQFRDSPLYRPRMPSVRWIPVSAAHCTTRAHNTQHYNMRTAHTGHRTHRTAHGNTRNTEPARTTHMDEVGRTVEGYCSSA
jgi:hypothetical protein